MPTKKRKGKGKSNTKKGGLLNPFGKIVSRLRYATRRTPQVARYHDSSGNIKTKIQRMIENANLLPIDYERTYVIESISHENRVRFNVKTKESIDEVMKRYKKKSKEGFEKIWGEIEDDPIFEQLYVVQNPLLKVEEPKTPEGKKRVAELEDKVVQLGKKIDNLKKDRVNANATKTPAIDVKLVQYGKALDDIKASIAKVGEHSKVLNNLNNNVIADEREKTTSEKNNKDKAFEEKMEKLCLFLIDLDQAEDYYYTFYYDKIYKFFGNRRYRSELVKTIVKEISDKYPGVSIALAKAYKLPYLMHLYENNELCLMTLKEYESCVGNKTLSDTFKRVCDGVETLQENLTRNIKFLEKSFRELLNVGVQIETPQGKALLEGATDFIYRDKMLYERIKNDKDTSYSYPFLPVSKDSGYLKYFDLWKEKINTCNMESLKVEETDTNVTNKATVTNVTTKS